MGKEKTTKSAKLKALTEKIANHTHKTQRYRYRYSLKKC